MDWTESHIISAALALGAERTPGWSDAERASIKEIPSLRTSVIQDLRKKIIAGDDPLGELFCAIRSPEQRREQGATYTPTGIIRTMVSWGKALRQPVRVVDAGTGSGRFMLEAGRQFPNAKLIGFEVDPIAAIMARGNLAAVGLDGRAQIVLGDYRIIDLPPVPGATFYTGNPPYVRHHLLGKKWKQWLVDQSTLLGMKASQLAGLHVHFFLRTVLQARLGDFGCFITAAEWLDVNYGSLVRDLFLSHLGGRRIVLIDPTARPFPDATTTAAVTEFEIGSHPKSIRLKRVKSLRDLPSSNRGRLVARKRLEKESRWSTLTRTTRPIRQGFVELGELFRVHRGQVTGANRIWIAGTHSEGLPARVLFPSVTKARELISAGLVLESVSNLRRVIDIPADLGVFDLAERLEIERFLKLAQSLGGSDSFIARNRKAWWSVGLRAPAPILATYMARRSPAFVFNKAQARHINIAHGLYPREAFSDKLLDKIVTYLSQSTNLNNGRTYAGGLTKFEPREMERIMVPSPQSLATH